MVGSSPTNFNFSKSRFILIVDFLQELRLIVQPAYPVPTGPRLLPVPFQYLNQIQIPHLLGILPYTDRNQKSQHPGKYNKDVLGKASRKCCQYP